jgi:GWxTD domain-containing protein
MRAARVVVRKLLLLLATAAASRAASPIWLDLVSPIIAPAEKKLYLTLNAEERARFEEEFWSHKAIKAEEYSKRIEYIDARFGSTKLASGTNTDQGRVYLALGPPEPRYPSSFISSFSTAGNLVLRYRPRPDQHRSTPDLFPEKRDGPP